MNYQTHNDAVIDVNFTSLQDCITADYEVLCAMFGEPMNGDGRKVDAEWHILFPDPEIVATIYNWKNGRNYRGPDGLDTKDIKDWHIGGHTALAAILVKQAIESALQEQA